jgi:hypothetical protein
MIVRFVCIVGVMGVWILGKKLFVSRLGEAKVSVSNPKF